MNFLAIGLLSLALMQRAQQEAENFAKEHRPDVKKIQVAEKDLLPEIETAYAEEVVAFLKETKKRERIDTDESFLAPSHAVVKNPLDPAGICDLITLTIPEDKKLETCREGGSFYASFNQALHVSVIPAKKEYAKYCKGHKREKSIFWKSQARDEKKHWQKDLAKDEEVSSYNVVIDSGGALHHHHVTAYWGHKNNIPSCDNYSIEETVIQEREEKEHWQASNPEGLEFALSNPSCKFLYSTVLKGPDNKIINGEPVFRPIWERQLLFSCEPDAYSKCAQLRNQGSMLIDKKCLEENVLGECSLWEKIYDLGKAGATQITKALFTEEEIWGLDDAFDTEYEKNHDFGPVFSTISLFSDLETHLEEGGADFHEKMEIFKGQPLKCQKSFVAGKLFDCCQKMQGVAVQARLAQCSEEEKCLSQRRNDGKCRFIGARKTKWGTVTEHVYCCFPTKLSRVLQEQGRQQLHLSWGSADHPQCKGFTLQEMQKIDLGRIDFWEVVEDVKADRTAFENQLRSGIGDFQRKISEKASYAHD